MAESGMSNACSALFYVLLPTILAMKNLLIAALALLLGACANDDVVESVTTSKPYIEVSVNVLNFSSAGDTRQVTVSTDAGAWTVRQSGHEWISWQLLNDSTVAVTVAENATESERSGRLTIVSSAGDRELSVRQNGREMLEYEGEDCRKSATCEAQSIVCNVRTNVVYHTEIIPDTTSWLSVRSSGINRPSFGGLLEGGTSQHTGNLTLELTANTGSEQRQASVRIYNDEYLLSDTIDICQARASAQGTLWRDGEVVVYQKSTVGNANLIVIGDGFTEKHMSRGGTYEKAVNDAVEHFFSIEPYTSYREYFNVYTMATWSPVEGVGNKSALGTAAVTNRFGTAFGSGTEVVCDSEVIFECVNRIEGMSDVPKTVIVVLNSDKYAGTTYLFTDGNSIALCPMSGEASPNDFEGLVHHEAGGHAFGFLCDEYIYTESEMPQSRKDGIRKWQKSGFQMNLDFTDDPDLILWHDFIGHPKYSRVGAYEGGYEYRYGVWRCEENSCMNNNIPYFNVQSRWSIVNRIMQLSDKPFTKTEFIARDNVEPPVSSPARNSAAMPPLASPVMVERK